MNLLAHALLSDGTTDGLLGSLMGDFVKGPLDERYRAAIRHGLVLHRRVDSFTDAHPVVAGSRARIIGARRRYAGILVDMFYDHFLARHWDDYSAEPLERFTTRVYAALLSHKHELPERLQQLAPNIASADWLGSYRDVAAIGIAVDRLGQRLTRGNALLGSVAELVSNYDAFRTDFRRFFPDVVLLACEQNNIRERG
ncbi:MAG: ACP phosphodiesterase [Betaproteobacteria bacterium]